MKSKFLFIVFLFPLLVYGQQLSHYTQYMFNDLIMNPAIAGTKPCKIIGVDYRKQWTGFNGAPTTGTVSFHGRFGKKTGLGAIVHSDEAGAVKIFAPEIIYAHHLMRTRNNLLSLGLSLTYFQYIINETGFVPAHPDDPLLLGQTAQQWKPDATFGIYYKRNKYSIGAGIKHLIAGKMKKFGPDTRTRVTRHLFVNYTYNHVVNSITRIEPSLLIKWIGTPRPQVDGNLRFIFNDNFWLGISYRTFDAFAGLVGFQVKKRLLIGYSYDYTHTALGKYNNGGHEIYLQFKICNGRWDQGADGSGSGSGSGNGGTIDACPAW